MAYKFEIGLFHNDLDIIAEVEANDMDDFKIVDILEEGEEDWVPMDNPLKDQIRRELALSSDFQRRIAERIEFIREGEAEKYREAS